jgi:uncharacterized protein (TIGR02246 family)
VSYFNSWSGHPGFQPLAGDVRSLPTMWAKAVSKRKVGPVLALYAPNAVLVPTFSKTILRGAPQLAEYFSEFLSRPGLRCRIENELVQDISPTCQVTSGDYTFMQNLRGNGRKVIRARFTFVLVREAAGTWKIATQHSSALPKV